MGRSLTVWLAPVRLCVPHWCARDMQRAEARTSGRLFAVELATHERAFHLEGLLGVSDTGLGVTGQVVDSRPSWWHAAAQVPIRSASEFDAIARLDLRRELGGLLPRVR